MSEKIRFTKLKKITTIERLKIVKIIIYNFELKKNKLTFIKNVEKKLNHLLIRRRAD